MQRLDLTLAAQSIDVVDTQAVQTLLSSTSSIDATSFTQFLCASSIEEKQRLANKISKETKIIYEPIRILKELGYSSHLYILLKANKNGYVFYFKNLIELYLTQPNSIPTDTSQMSVLLFILDLLHQLIDIEANAKQCGAYELSKFPYVLSSEVFHATAANANALVKALLNFRNSINDDEDYLNALQLAATRGYRLITDTLLSQPMTYAGAEMSSYEASISTLECSYGNELELFTQLRLAALHRHELNHDNPVVAKHFYYLLRYVIRRQSNDNVAFLLSIPVIAALADKELLCIALKIGNLKAVSLLSQQDSVIQAFFAYKKEMMQLLNPNARLEALQCIIKSITSTGRHFEAVRELEQSQFMHEYLNEDSLEGLMRNIKRGDLAAVANLLNSETVKAALAIERNVFPVYFAAIETRSTAMVNLVLRNDNLYNYVLHLFRNRPNDIELYNFIDSNILELKDKIETFEQTHPGDEFDLPVETAAFYYKLLTFLFNEVVDSYIKTRSSENQQIVLFLLSIPSINRLVRDNSSDGRNRFFGAMMRGSNYGSIESFRLSFKAAITTPIAMPTKPRPQLPTLTLKAYPALPNPILRSRTRDDSDIAASAPIEATVALPTASEWYSAFLSNVKDSRALDEQTLSSLEPRAKEALLMPDDPWRHSFPDHAFWTNSTDNLQTVVHAFFIFTCQAYFSLNSNERLATWRIPFNRIVRLAEASSTNPASMARELYRFGIRALQMESESRDKQLIDPEFRRLLELYIKDPHAAFQAINMAKETQRLYPFIRSRRPSHQELCHLLTELQERLDLLNEECKKFHGPAYCIFYNSDSYNDFKIFISRFVKKSDQDKLNILEVKAAIDSLFLCLRPENSASNSVRAAIQLVTMFRALLINAYQVTPDDNIASIDYLKNMAASVSCFLCNLIMKDASIKESQLIFNWNNMYDRLNNLYQYQISSDNNASDIKLNEVWMLITDTLTSIKNPPIRPRFHPLISVLEDHNEYFALYFNPSSKTEKKPTASLAAHYARTGYIASQENDNSLATIEQRRGFGIW